MYASHDRLTPAPVRQDAPCMCAHGGACSSFAPGHAVHLIQARLVSATPAQWEDAIVTTVERSAGRIVLHRLEDGADVELWNGAGIVDAVVPGSPVAYHPRHHAVHAAGRVFNVAPLA
ncbi:hypothetical protein LJR045_001125 [Microbacterium sp. LjRoot45]|uniref:hypothetical protein n=1 Tax=Microbacterium sp. LjRoot45 TaxID=3342329 RepID=UPI003ECFA2BD